MRLNGKRVLITGTAGGQGAAAAALFAREGARVVGCDIQPGAAQRSAAALAAEGLDVTGHTVDLGDAAATERWVEEAAEHLGGIDVLYNNASGSGFAPFAEMTLELWHHVMRVELDVVFNASRSAWKHLVAAGGGSLISTGSISGLRGLAPLGQAAHAAAKGGVEALTRSLAAEGAAHGIRANVIAPGYVASPATANLPVQARDFSLDTMLIRRPGTGIDIAYLALYLACDESSWVTGQTYSIDGGATSGFR